MFFSKSEPNKSKTIEALIPMVDLFAVLAIVFMIYSSDEIIASQEQSQEMIEQIAIDYKKLQEEVAAAEQARQERREILAQNAVKSLEEIQSEREQKAKQLITEFTQMLAEQQNQAAVEYETLVAKFEVEHEQEVERQKAELEAEKQKDVETKVTGIRAGRFSPGGTTRNDHAGNYHGRVRARKRVVPTGSRTRRTEKPGSGQA
jgi:hypothetical protein